jgi:hypothetical protein
VQIRKLALSFQSAKDFRSRVEILPKGPPWMSTTVHFDGYPTKAPITLYYRDSLKCMAFLMRNPLFDGLIDWTPRRCFMDSLQNTRVFGEWATSEGAWELQVRLLFILISSN